MIPLFKVHMNENAAIESSKILNSGYITQGTQVDKFENALQKKFNNNRILTLNSATAGLTLAIRLLKKYTNDGDVVLSTPLTCTATNWAILANNLKIKWIDTDPNTCNIDLDDLKSKLSPKTKIIMLVHWGGYPVNLDKLNDVRDYCYQKYGFRPWVVEDCAHAFGAKYNNKLLGNHGNICVYSFQAIKELTTIDGGCIILPNDDLYDRCKLLRWYGIDRDRRNYKKTDFRLEHDIAEWGYKAHMNDVNATIGLCNIGDIDENVNKRRENAKYFKDKLKDVKGIELLSEEDECLSAYWLFTIKIKNNRKQEFMDYMNNERKIMVSQVHNRNDIHSCISDSVCNLPQLDELEKEIVCIPVGWWLTQENREYILESIKLFF